jgi:two-component system response regulator CpxR
MPVIGIFSGTFCNQKAVVREIQNRIGFGILSDSDIVKKASALCGIAENKIERAFSAKTSVFNNFTHEKERSIAHMKLAVAQMLHEDKLVFSGFSSQLIPQKITHVLRICLIADLKFRKEKAGAEMQLSKRMPRLSFENRMRIGRHGSRRFMKPRTHGTHPSTTWSFPWTR